MVIIAFVTNYIPNIGFVIGVIPPALLGLLDGGPATKVFLMPAGDGCVSIKKEVVL